MLSARLFGLVCSVLLAAHLYLMLSSLRDGMRAVETEDKLRRLCAVTAQNFPAHEGLTEEAFWKHLGRAGNPMQDSWGEGLRLEAKGAKEFFWRSAGPDRAFGTSDDLERRVPKVGATPVYDEAEPSATMDAR
jgi:hypothetical protein